MIIGNRRVQLAHYHYGLLVAIMIVHHQKELDQHVEHISSSSFVRPRNDQLPQLVKSFLIELFQGQALDQVNKNNCPVKAASDDHQYFSLSMDENRGNSLPQIINKMKGDNT